MNADIRLFNALVRLDLYAFMQRVFLELEPGTPFLPNWHYEHLCHKLTQVLEGEVKRLIINVPPRSGKSILASVAFPMFALGHDPAKRVICVSHTENLAREFSVNRRTIALSPWYGRAFPLMRLSTARPRDMELRTTDHGQIFAAGVGGAVLGRGADIIIVDDPIKPLAGLSKAERRRAAEFYDNTLITRLNDKVQGAVIIVMQRLHEEDLVGHVLQRGDWDVVSLPAIAEDETRHALSDLAGDDYLRRSGELLHADREPTQVLEDMRRVQGSLIFQAQYQQAPTPAGGLVIKREWLRWFEEPPERFDRTVVSWDTASTLKAASDYSVGTVWGVKGLDYYLLEVVRGKFETPQLRRKIMELSAHHRADATLMEATDLGRALEQDLRHSASMRLILQQPLYDKEARLLAQSARFEAGQVHLPTNATGIGAYLEELLGFPNSAHDDQVDSTSQALNYLTWRADRPEPPDYQQQGRRRAVRSRVVRPRIDH